MLEAVLIIDESGAKGYSNNQEREVNEVGVIAGYLVPAHGLAKLRKIANGLFEPIITEGKLHIAELTTEQQNQVREGVFSLLKQNNSCWLYQAISVQGFYEANNLEARGSFEEKKELLHSKLFLELFAKAISLLRRNLGDNKSLSISIITDRLDAGIIKRFKADSQDYIKALTKQPIVSSFTRYNKESKTVEKCTTETIIKSEDPSVYLDAINYDIKCEDTPITFIADILVNSTFYYLNKKLAEDPKIKLNSKQAIEDHPLSHLVFGAYDADLNELSSFGDLVYRREALQNE
ncbi:MAG: hypothetical protein ACI8WB_000157 [Phenylobacterium sp.]|jgi:hypothetical protein